VGQDNLKLFPVVTGEAATQCCTEAGLGQGGSHR
jgi:hypothetical protein